MKRASLVATLIVVGTAFSARADDKAQTTEAVGQGPIVDGNIQAAKEKAQDDAMRNCVQQVAGTIVTAATETDQSQLLSDKIFSHSTGYIRSHQTLESKQDGNTWVMKLKCEVSEGKLDEDMMAFGIAYQRAGMPRTMVLIAEQAVNATKATGWWQGGGNATDLRITENAFMKRMEKSGFTFIDADVLQGKVKLEAVGADPNTQQAREFGKLTGAELVIIGRVIAKPLGETIPNSGWYSSVATISARAVATDSGEIIATEEFTSKAEQAIEQTAAGNKALSRAGIELSQRLFAKVGQAWAKQQSGAKRIAMAVKGVDDYARLANFKMALVNGVRGVKDVQERSMEDGRADLDVMMAGSSQTLAAELSTKKFQGYNVKVRKVTSSTIEVELK